MVKSPFVSNELAWATVWLFLFSTCTVTLVGSSVQFPQLHWKLLMDPVMKYPEIGVLTGGATVVVVPELPEPGRVHAPMNTADSNTASATLAERVAIVSPSWTNRSSWCDRP